MTPEIIGVAAEVPLNLAVYWFCSVVVVTSGRLLPFAWPTSLDGAQTMRLGPGSL